MKILSIKEKAEAYDKVSKEVREFFEGKRKAYTKDVSQTLEHLFPELKEEGESERTRIEILGYIRGKYISQYPSSQPTPPKDTLSDWIKWLEKQSKPNPYSGTSFEYDGHTWGMCARDGGVEILYDGNLKAFISLEKSFIYPNNNNSQGSTAPEPVMETVKKEKADVNEDRPKFKIGNWIVKPNGEVRHIIDIKDLCYIFSKDESHYWKTHFCDQECHLWTIEDAKDGDVLVTSDGNPFIYKGRLDPKNPDSPVAYCGIDNGGYFCYCEDIDDWWTDGEIYPATEEQRKLLFQKMEGTGWEWDSENKKLIRL